MVQSGSSHYSAVRVSSHILPKNVVWSVEFVVEGVSELVGFFTWQLGALVNAVC